MSQHEQSYQSEPIGPTMQPPVYPFVPVSRGHHHNFNPLLPLLALTPFLFYHHQPRYSYPEYPAYPFYPSYPGYPSYPFYGGYPAYQAPYYPPYDPSSSY